MGKRCPLHSEVTSGRGHYTPGARASRRRARYMRKIISDYDKDHSPATRGSGTFVAPDEPPVSEGHGPLAARSSLYLHLGEDPGYGVSGVRL